MISLLLLIWILKLTTLQLRNFIYNYQIWIQHFWYFTQNYTYRNKYIIYSLLYNASNIIKNDMQLQQFLSFYSNYTNDYLFSSTYIFYSINKQFKNSRGSFDPVTPASLWHHCRYPVCAKCWLVQSSTIAFKTDISDLWRLVHYIYQPFV